MRFVVDLDNVHRYRPGGHAETVQRRYGLDQVVKLASNEFPLPPVAGVREAIAGVLDELNRYPDSAAGDLRAALRRDYGLPEERDRGRQRLARGPAAARARRCWRRASRPSSRRRRSRSTARCATCTGRRRARCRCATTSPTSTRWRRRSARARPWSSSATRTTRPAPTCPRPTWRGSSTRVPDDVVVVLDEAYNEFVTSDDAQDTPARCSNVTTTCASRAPSRRSTGCAACASATGSAPRPLRGAIDTLRQPFNTSLVAQVAATEALRHQDEVRGAGASQRGAARAPRRRARRARRALAAE